MPGLYLYFSTIDGFKVKWRWIKSQKEKRARILCCQEQIFNTSLDLKVSQAKEDLVTSSLKRDTAASHYMRRNSASQEKSKRKLKDASKIWRL